MSHDVTFDLVNLVMSETGVPKKFRLNNFLKKSLIVLKSQGTFVPDAAIENVTAKKEMDSSKLASVATVSVRFRSKERGTRVKDCAKNGASKRAGRGWGRKFPSFHSLSPLFHFLALVSFLGRPKPVFLCSETKRRKRLLRRQHVNMNRFFITFSK